MAGSISSFDRVTSSYPTPRATQVDSAPIMRSSAGTAASTALSGAAATWPVAFPVAHPAAQQLPASSATFNRRDNSVMTLLRGHAVVVLLPRAFAKVPSQAGDAATRTSSVEVNAARASSVF